MGPAFEPHQVAIVTGSSSGIGAATVVKLAQKGVNKFCITGRNVDGLERTKKMAAEVNQSLEFVSVIGDLTQQETMEKIVEETMNKFGRIDILVNNAGWAFEVIPIFDHTIENYDKTMEMNVRTVVVLTKLCLPFLRKSKGNIVTTSSVASVRCLENFAFYCMSKAAVDMFTKCMALEEGKNGIRINSVLPGFVDTGIHVRAGMDRAVVEQVIENCATTHPVGRGGTAEEIANMIVFLASKEATFITGSLNVVDGGVDCYNPL